MIALADPLALLWIAILAPVLLAASHAARLRREADDAFGGAPVLRRGRHPWRRRLQEALLLGAIVLAVIAVARPQWGEEDRPLRRLGIDIAIALDISRSMTANDVEPSRAEAASAAIDDLFNHLRGDRVGLVTFAGDAFERSPLTLDLDAVRQLVARAQDEPAFVRPGTDLAAALEAALRLLDIEGAAETQTIVLISDGENLGEDLDEALDEARDAGVRVFTVAAGTADGGAMAARVSGEGAPEATPGPATDATRDEVSRADRPTMQRIAETTGGDLRELGELPGLAVEFQRLRQSAFDEGADRAPVERFQWFLGGALLLLVVQALVADAGWRRRLRVGRLSLATGALPLIALIVACAGAEYAATRDGHEAYDAGRYDDALASYRDAESLAPDAPEPPYNIGNTLHRLGRYEEATVASGAAMSDAADPELFARAAYALGSHAFRRNDLEAARDAWISVLLRDPSDLDAKHNLELALRLLAPAEEPPETPDADGGGTGGEGAGEGEGESEEPENEDGGSRGGGDRQPAGTPTPDATPAPDTSNNPGAPSESAESSSPAGRPGGQVDPEQPSSLEDARALLAEEALRIGDEALTIEDAIALLELVRRASELEALDPRGGAGGAGDR